MNGSLNLEHAFTISNAEFNTNFQDSLGNRVLFPWGTIPPVCLTRSVCVFSDLIPSALVSLEFH